jgi:hypothetical protein
METLTAALRNRQPVSGREQGARRVLASTEMRPVERSRDLGHEEDKYLSCRFVVLMTATIAPMTSSSMSLVRADPSERRADYESGLRFWLSLDADWLAGVVFAENSASSLDSLKSIADSENPRRVPVEFLSYKYPPPPSGLHYGYSEFNLVREAVSDSVLINRESHFIKATGRLQFPDIDRLVRTMPPNLRVAIDCKLSRGLSKKHRHYVAQVPLVLFERRFYVQHVSDMPDRMVPAPPWTRAQFAETMLFDQLTPCSNDPGVILRWTVNCEPEGVGANGTRYRSFKRRYQARIRALGRVLCPGLWI